MSAPSAHLIHLVSGSTGAGKTSYAIKIADRLGAIRFSIDEWMADLFWMDSPQPLDPAWSIARVERCMTRLWAVAMQAAQRGVPCVLDVALTTAEQRAKLVRQANTAGLSVQLHFVDAPVEERWRRVMARNAEKAETYQLPFDVTREMFDFVETLWEPPTDAEMAACDGVRFPTAHS